MAESPKQRSDYLDGLGQMINGFRGSSTISVSDQMMMMNAESDAFIVDLESFSNGGLDKDVTSNSRIYMQRSYSKKGYLGGDQESLLVSSSSSPRGAGQGSTPEKLGAVAYSQAGVVVEVGATHPSSNNNNQTGSFIASKTRWDRRQYNSFKRSPPPHWFFFSFSDPKRVLLFFATLSTLGTILLIYFTLSMRSTYEYDSNPEWQS